MSALTTALARDLKASAPMRARLGKKLEKVLQSKIRAKDNKTRKIKIIIELTTINNGINSYHLSIKDHNQKIETNTNFLTNTGSSIISPIDPFLLKIQNKIENTLKSLAKNYHQTKVTWNQDPQNPQASKKTRNNPLTPTQGKTTMPETDPVLENNYTHHTPIPGQQERYEAIREKAKELAYLIKNLTLPSREQSLAQTQLETAIFWANAAIARNE